MSRSRLDAVAPDLVEWGGAIANEKRKEIALRVARWACDEANLNLTNTSRDGVAKLSEYYDENYFSEYERNNGELNDVAVKFFRMARAASAMWYALSDDMQNDFFESLYESSASTEDLNKLKWLCGA